MQNRGKLIFCLHNINYFFNLYLNCGVKTDENKQKEDGTCPFEKIGSRLFSPEISRVPEEERLQA